jgi:hypothetical protein
MMPIIFLSLLVVKYKKGGITSLVMTLCLSLFNFIVMKVLVRFWFHDVQWGMGHGFKDLMI